MFVSFRKNLYTNVPNRWYACDNIYGIGPAVIKFFDGADNEKILSDKLKNSGFDMLREERMFGPEAHDRYYCPYLEFNDPVEEARFIMWASGGITI